MTEKIVRSVTAHSVETSAITKNAVNPRNHFIDQKKTTLAEPTMEIEGSELKDKHSVAFEESPAVDAGAAPDYPSFTDHYDTRNELTQAKAHLRDNRQKLQSNTPQDNIQQIAQVAYKDTVLYQEKKNIHANFQSVRESLQRAVAKLPAHARSSSTDEFCAPENTGFSNPVSHDDINFDDAHLLLNGDLGVFDEDELRARVRKMQEKLTRVNQTLKDIENKK